MHGTRVWFHGFEAQDSTCHGAPTEFQAPRAGAPQQDKSPWWEACTSWLEKARTATKTQCIQINRYICFKRLREFWLLPSLCSTWGSSSKTLGIPVSELLPNWVLLLKPWVQQPPSPIYVSRSMVLMGWKGDRFWACALEMSRYSAYRHTHTHSEAKLKHKVKHTLEELMLKLKFQYFGQLTQKADPLEKTLMLGKIEGRRRRGWQRMRWLDGITGHESERTPEDSGGQGSLACCSPWGCKEADTTVTEQHDTLPMFRLTVEIF